jgi:Fur family transcriptional regulator, ferric uptake regulator
VNHQRGLETGTVIEFRNAEIERLQEEITRQLGFRLVRHRLELYAVLIPASQRQDENLA